MTRRRSAAVVCQARHRTDPDRPRQAATGLNLCPGCLAALRRNLADLPALHADVIDQMPARTTAAAGPAVSGSHGAPLPLNLAASDIAGQIELDLDRHTRWVARVRGLTRPKASVPAQVAWLAPHVEWMAADVDAPHVRATFGELVGRAYAVIDPARRPLPIGPCVELLDGELCPGRVCATVRREGDPTPGFIYCDTCTLQLDTTQWHRFGRRYARTREKMAG